MPAKSNAASASGSTIGFGAKLWLTAEKLRNNIPGLIFPGYLSENTARERNEESFPRGRRRALHLFSGFGIAVCEALNFPPTGNP